MKTHLTLDEIEVRAKVQADRIAKFFGPGVSPVLKAHPIPRGGVPAALAISAALKSATGVKLELTEDPNAADLIIDDIIDSGATRDRYVAEYGLPLFALVNKRTLPDSALGWVVFPWEGSEGGIEDNITRLLQYVGEDPKRGGLLETPDRVARAWKQWTRGYSEDPASILKVFEDGAEKCDELVVVKNIPIYSHCEHHLAAIFGTATIAYIPNGRIVGLSKLSRLADAFARRLQVQERLTNQIADALDEHLKPKGVGVVVKARHLCMESRGVCQQGHHTITSALRGVLRTSPETRSEFMALAKE